MNTRVSWIEEGHLQALIARLETTPPELPDESDPPIELATLPDSGGFLDEEAPPAPQVQEPCRDDCFPEQVPPSPGDNSSAGHDETPTRSPAEDETQPVQGADVSLPLERIRERLKMIRHRAVEAGLLHRAGHAPQNSPGAPAEPSPPDILMPATNGSSIVRFAEVAASSLPPGSTLMILDQEGGVLWSNEPKPGLMLSMLMAQRSTRHGSAEMLAGQAPVIHHALPPDAVLTTTSVPTQAGTVEIAVKNTLPLDESYFARWREAAIYW